MGSVRMMQEGCAAFRDRAERELDEGVISSPRTTIVGGRPPELGPKLPAVPTGLQQLLRLASVNEDFCQRMMGEPLGMARAAQIVLNATEVAILGAISPVQLAQMARQMPRPTPERLEPLLRAAARALGLGD